MKESAHRSAGLRFRRLLLLAVMVGTIEAGASAQTESDFEIWAAVFFTGRVFADTPSPTFWLDAHARRSESGTVHILRPGVGLAFTSWGSLWLGYAWTPTWLDATGERRDEHRVWEQLTLDCTRVSGLLLQSRTRFEQRFQTGSSGTAHRFRQFVRLNYRPAQRVPVGIAFFDEVFVGIQGAGWAKQGFDQNRAYNVKKGSSRMTVRLIATLVIGSFVLQACKQETSDPPKAVEAPATAAPGQAMEDMPEPLVEPVLTREQRDALTPDEIVEAFRAGNQRFATGDLTVRDHTAQVRAAATGQFPKAVVLSCLDSRVPVEDVFDRGIGDLFVARVAGNFENTDILGSIEFATKVAGSKVVLVLGHEHCGAVKGAVDGVEIGNITPMLENIQPAVQAVSSYEGDKSSKNEEFVHMVAEENVRQTVKDIRQRSAIVRELEDAGSLKILGAMYDMDTGEVEFLD